MSSTVITSVEMDRLRTTYPLVDLDPLTAQEEKLLLYRLRGHSPAAAARACGMDKTRGVALLETEKFVILMDHLIQQMRPLVTVDRDLLNTMMLDSHAKASSVSDEMMVIRELGKINDLYPSEKKQISINSTSEIKNSRQLEQLSDEELSKISGDVIDLDPEDITEVSDSG